MASNDAALPPRLPRWGILFFCGMVATISVFFLNHAVGLIITEGDHTPFSVDPRVSALVWDETTSYAPGPSRFFHSGRLLTELGVYELRHLRNPLPVTHSVLLGIAAKIVGSLEWAWMISHSILPTMTWALLFWIALRAVRSPVIAMAIAWTTCFISFAPRNFLLIGHDRFIQPLELTRMPPPGLTFLLLLFAIWLLVRALLDPKLWRIVAAGIVAGALFYSYYFYWVAFFSGVACLVLTFAIIKSWRDLKTALSVLVLGSLVGIYFFIWTLEGMAGGYQRQLMERTGIFTRQIDLVGLVLAAALFITLVVCARTNLVPRRDLRITLSVLLAVSTGAAIGLNFQLVTGFDAQHVHFYHRVLQPVIMFIVLLSIASAACATQRLRRDALIIATVAICMLLPVAVLRQVKVAINTATYHRNSNADMDALLWLRSRIPPDTVVGSTDGDVLTLIPGITGTWTFVPVGDLSMATSTEILLRYLVLCRLEGRDWRDVESNLTSNRGFGSLSFIFTLQLKFSDESIQFAQSLWNNLDTAAELRTRRLDYVISKRKEGLPGIPETTETQLVYRNSIWAIYRLIFKPS